MKIETYIRAVGTQGTLVDASNMPAAVTPPTTCLGMSAEMRLHFFNGDASEQMTAEDFEAISAWRLSVDDDYNQSTDPVLRFTSGITVGDDGTVEISIPNVSSQKLVTGLGTRASGSYIAELAGYAAGETVPVFVVQFPFNVLNRIDLEGGSESVPVEGNYYTNSQVEALLASAYEFSFSADGESWHSTQGESDIYFRVRNGAVSGAQWSDAIVLPRGRDGIDGNDGDTPNITVGTVTTLNTGQPATADITGTTPNLVLNLGIPKGPTGAAGASSYTYVAWAATSTGEGFSLVQSSDLPYRAEIVSRVAIETPTATDFAGATWVKYIDVPANAMESPETTVDGATTYIDLVPGKIYNCSLSSTSTSYVFRSTGLSIGYVGMSELFLTAGSGVSYSFGSSFSFADNGAMVSGAGTFHLLIQWRGATGYVLEV